MWYGAEGLGQGRNLGVCMRVTRGVVRPAKGDLRRTVVPAVECVRPSTPICAFYVRTAECGLHVVVGFAGRRACRDLIQEPG